VKSHALAIYHKLAVSSRDEAIVRARALGLVASSLGE
jgi:ATP/maltotriose-dependent transcriptional regulator MalT